MTIWGFSLHNLKNELSKQNKMNKNKNLKTFKGILEEYFVLFVNNIIRSFESK